MKFLRDTWKAFQKIGWRSSYRRTMHKKKIIRFLHSLALLPVLTSMPLSANMPKSQTPLNINLSGNAAVVLAPKKNTEAANSSIINKGMSFKAKTVELRGEAIDAYFRAYEMPLAGTGHIFAQASELYGLDWRLLPAIAVRESTGGKHACSDNKYNVFGWDSCRVRFSSYTEAIDTVAKNLSGKNAATEKYYKGKDTKEILLAYNPPTIVPGYAPQVMYIMKLIGTKDLVYTETA